MEAAQEVCTVPCLEHSGMALTKHAKTCSLSGWQPQSYSEILFCSFL